MDTQIGLILEALDKSGKRDNTYIIFTADHGLAIGSHGLMGKQNMYDHSIRAPFILVGPEIGENKRIDTDIYLQDAMATSLALAGIEKPSYVEFHSILGLARGKTTTGSYPAIYGAYINDQRMIRKDNWKLIVYPKASKVILFNIAADPGETNDVSKDVAYQRKVKSLFDELMVIQDHLQDNLDLSDLYKQTIKQ
jgi:arylsulfatase A-like enzyme